MVGLGLLLIRLVIGLSFMAHGAKKLFGGDLKVIGAYFEKLGIRPGITMALLAGLSELIGGAMFALGLLTPLAGVVIAGTMVVGILKVHGPNGYWITKNGYEYCLAILVVAIAVALTGAGEYSLDALLK
ncbi:DoxX family protein [Paenibacillus filicis]|uniref:DoxX family protein n=1 Tax=Paenibacillus gyeongsangnamensis TaxID=3388067 RepID=A0ABT4QDP8_9BACL|nr:DoxX family protein [Paenibacillus filicis]MCZ8514970.1 DoxX family protein [Paenibacillus filicis]